MRVQSRRARKGFGFGAFACAALITPAVLSLAVAACSSSARTPAPLTASSDGDAGVDGNAPAVVDDPDHVVATLHGKVLAPEGTIPIGGALVALLDVAPDPLVSGLHCDKCVDLPRDVPRATSAADGSFSLDIHRTGHHFLLVQKGNFRRVRPLDVATGDAEVPAVLSTLPAKMDVANGDTIPKMAVAIGQWDHIERSLVKLGLGKLVADEVDKTSAPFDIYDDPSPTSPTSSARLVADPSLLSKYDIVFIPCTGSSGVTCNDTRPGDPTVQGALRDYVEGGGRLYATDYSYEFVRQLWPDPIEWAGQSSTLGTACESEAYDAEGQVDDTGLGDWLTAIGSPNVTLRESWTTIAAVHDFDGTDVDGNAVKVSPHVWMSAKKTDGVHPATVSFQRGCGRVLFSTYHTASTDPTQPLLPQEKALLYVLLEVAVCVNEGVPR